MCKHPFCPTLSDIGAETVNGYRKGAITVYDICKDLEQDEICAIVPTIRAYRHFDEGHYSSFTTKCPLGFYDLKVLWTWLSTCHDELKNGNCQHFR